MADPTGFNQSYDFSDFQDDNPSTPLPAEQVDIQLADIETSITSLRSAIMDIRRSDGALQNGIVTVDSLAASFSVGFTLRGDWADATDYVIGDGVAYDTSFYKAKSSHTSAPATRPDLDASTWEFLFTFEAIAIEDNSVTTAKIVDANVTAAKIGSGAVTEAKIGSGAVTADKIGSGAVVEAKIGSGAVTEDKIGAAAVTVNKIGSGAVTAAKLGSSAVTTDKIADANVTTAKLASALQPGREDFAIPAYAWTPQITNGPAAGATELSTNKQVVDSLDFDTTTQEFAVFRWYPPKRWGLGTITFKAYWTAASGSGGVAWALQAVAGGDTDDLDAAYGTEQVVTDTFQSANKVHMTAESAAITIAGTPADEDGVWLRIKRVPANVSDTLAVDAKLTCVKIFYTVDQANDA